MGNLLHARVTSPLGTLIITEEEGRITGLAIFDSGNTVPQVASCNSPVLFRAAAQLEEYFSGMRTEFRLPLRLPAGRPFSAKVLGLLCAIPYGTAVTYGELALRAGSPGAARAVGQVMAANPLPIIIPCHRVLAVGGRLGGYSGGRGVLTKKWLLDFEAAHARRSESATL